MIVFSINHFLIPSNCYKTKVSPCFIIFLSFEYHKFVLLNEHGIVYEVEKNKQNSV